MTAVVFWRAAAEYEDAETASDAVETRKHCRRRDIGGLAGQ